MSEPAFASAVTVAQAIALLAEAGPEARLLAGGTNLLADYRSGKHRPRLVVDITRVEGLHGWRDQGSTRAFGPLVTCHQLIEAPDLGPELACLWDGAIVFGGPPIRYRATLGGNLADASPATDLVPPLMALGAEITLDGPGGARTMPLTTFFLGYRQTALAADEIITGIRVALAGPGSGSSFHKFGNRESDAIAVVSAAAWVRLRDGQVADARVALGSVAPTVVRAPRVEAALRGRSADPAAVREAAQQVLRDISPISDLRGSADYRRALAPILTRRAVLDAVARARSRPASPPPIPIQGEGALFQPLAPLSKGGEGTGEGDLGSADRSASPRANSHRVRAGVLHVELTVNGKMARVDVEPHETLLAALRNRLGLLGTKEGCGQGDCGACTILYDGGPANACLILAGQAAGRRIETVEGLGTRDRLHPIQEAFVREGAIQCGFCTPGLLMSAKALLDQVPDPTPEQVRMAISGNLCRCTGYTKIVQAVLYAARILGARAGGRASAAGCRCSGKVSL